jgi:hypothetical protein
MYIKDYLIRGVRKGYRTITQNKFNAPVSEINREISNENIFRLLDNSGQCMISRLGTTELIAITNYLCINSKESFPKKIINYVVDHTQTPWWFEDHFQYMNIYSGIFPPTKQTAIAFAERYLTDIPLIDLLGSFQYYEKFMPFKSNLINVHLETLYPFFVEKPWSKALEGKKVLVVHPFEETIRHQYKRRHLLFNNSNILPDFDLITLRAVQSAAGIEVKFQNWFEALAYMEKEIEKINFDICLLGCGAYGLPLAAFVKRLGKKSIHLGGGLQLLFGIKGKRWDDPNYGLKYNIPGLFNKSYSSLYNDHWIKPLESDTPATANTIDGACYW